MFEQENTVDKDVESMIGSSRSRKIKSEVEYTNDEIVRVEDKVSPDVAHHIFGEPEHTRKPRKVEDDEVKENDNLFVKWVIEYENYKVEERIFESGGSEMYTIVASTRQWKQALEGENLNKA